VVSGRDGEPGACPTEGPRNERDRERFCDEADADTTEEPVKVAPLASVSLASPTPYAAHERAM